jgi:hypothetical protein
MKPSRLTFLLFGLVIAGIFSEACKKKAPSSPAQVAITDDALFDKAFETGYTFYMGNSDTLGYTPLGGGHSGLIRVRFNAIAQSALGTDGRLPSGAVFPSGSLVVKELYQQRGGPLYAIAIMLKSPSDPNAASGWVWGEYYADRRKVAPVANKGSQCVGCHSITATNSPVPDDSGHRDFVRTFGLR